MTAVMRTPPVDPETGHVHVIIETPKGSRNKLDYDETYGVFRLGGVLPAGTVFPYDFGMVPGTLGGDGDPLDVLVLLDEPVPTGCLVLSRLIGVIEAEQTEGGATRRNDRLIAVAVKSPGHDGIRRLDDLPELVIDEIEHFFTSYNHFKDKRFNVLQRSSTERAHHIIDEGIRRHTG